MSASAGPARMLLPDNSKLYIIPQADCHPIALFDPNVLKAARQGIASFVQLAICQALLLVPHNGSANTVNLFPAYRRGNDLGHYERWTLPVGRDDLGKVLRDSILE